MIFEMKSKANTYKTIAKYLIENKILTPKEYKLKQRGMDYALVPWGFKMVRDIVITPLYTCDTYNYARMRKNGKLLRLPIDKRTVLRNIHPEIVSHELFNADNHVYLVSKPFRKYEDFEIFTKFFYSDYSYLCTSSETKIRKLNNGIKHVVDMSINAIRQVITSKRILQRLKS